MIRGRNAEKQEKIKHNFKKNSFNYGFYFSNRIVNIR